MIRYRKTSRGWVAFGPVDEVRVGAVTVTTSAGKEKPERVIRLGRPFDRDGVEHVYGYLAEREQPTRPRSNGNGRKRRRRGSCDCDQPCCRPRCFCDSSCNCKGGQIYDC